MGGLESQDWSKMLLKMYLDWSEENHFKTNILDIVENDYNGIKSATVEITGKGAFGSLQSETGIHRLIRMSPFDSNGRKHTAFASVCVFPESNNEIINKINLSDLKIETFCSGGKGGQNVNKVETAVRIIHIPTNTVAVCQSERTQGKNKDMAFKLLQSKLDYLEKEKAQKEMDAIEKNKAKNEWSSQIRTYSFHPHAFVKDHRTDTESHNLQSVLNGNLELFVKAYRKKFK